MTCKGHDSKPVLILCPVCQTGPIGQMMGIISRTCDGCKKLQKA